MDSNGRRPEPDARVVAVQESLVSIRVPGGAITKNEVAYIRPARTPEVKLPAEVLRVEGNRADLQVYEETTGVALGDPVDLTRQLLSVRLGPGLLGQVYDGLQNPLHALAESHGFFLPRGVQAEALDHGRRWSFRPTARIGQRVKPGSPLGEVSESFVRHQIMVPFDELSRSELVWIQEGDVTVDTPVARIRRLNGSERDLFMAQTWPVRLPMASRLIEGGWAERVYPSQPLVTTLRIIDTFFPIARGGTACIPGPFGAGKTVLQNLISRYSAVDVVIIVACGERAGEVVETITEFPGLEDPRTGGSLMDRTVIICNTSSMPVAARESSIYTGITIGEYYRLMGLDVLVLADSTSRWAQAMRETSGRMEEIPGEEAFPAYLDSAIKSVYERAGVVRVGREGDEGSLTLIGTVSPAGGNFEEPVTQSTLSTVKTFLGLSADRAYRRFYPAVDPLISWSRYLEQLRPWFAKHVQGSWIDDVRRTMELLKEGDQIRQMMQVTGEEGVTLDDFVTQQKATLVDMVYLQQDAFDPVDVSMPLERQRESFHLLLRLIRRDFRFDSKEEARRFFTRLTELYKNLNYSAPGHPDFERYRNEIESLAFGPDGAAGTDAGGSGDP
jgi:V/A-type H+/Na+-transporting ATPase subunit A